MSLKEAEALDSKEAPFEATRAYENAIEEQDVGLETYLNLAVLYWVATEFGYYSFHHLPDDFVAYAERRARVLLREAEERFGNHNEIDFWRYYFDHISFGAAPRVDFCQKLVARGPSLVPCFHLFALTGNPAHREGAELLLKAMEPPRTERERYVVSVLRSTLRIRAGKRHEDRL